MNKIEIAVESMTPVLIAVLLLMMAIELIFSELPHDVHMLFFVLEWCFIVPVLFVELYFKYKHSKNFISFVKGYWLHMLALIPIYPIFKGMELFGFFREAAVAEGAVVSSRLSQAEELVRAERFLTDTERLARAEGLLATERIVASAGRAAKVEELVRAERLVADAVKIERAEELLTAERLVTSAGRAAKAEELVRAERLASDAGLLAKAEKGFSIKNFFRFGDVVPKCQTTLHGGLLVRNKSARVKSKRH